MSEYKELEADALRRSCGEDEFDFETTDDLEPREDIIGQDRALRALELGLDIDAIGYNIFITGLTGTGRTTTIKKLLEELDKGTEAPDDICYVNNFRNQDLPTILTMKGGTGCSFRNAMERLIDTLCQSIPKVFQSESFRKHRSEVDDDLRNEQKELLLGFENKAKERGFQLVQMQMGFFTRSDLAPMVDGSPVNFKQLRELADQGKIAAEDIDKLEEDYKALSQELQSVYVAAQNIEDRIREKLEELERDTVSPIIKGAIGRLKGDFGQNENVNAYLEDVEQSLLDNLQLFKKPEDGEPGESLPDEGDPFLEYRVNVLVDNQDLSGRPVVVEHNPSYRNLFGTIERSWRMGDPGRTDFTMIKAGSFLRANGGYLVLNAFDALVEPGVWLTLKRALRNRRQEIRPFDPTFLTFSPSINPEAVEVNTKVVMIGDSTIYSILFDQDEDFQKIFKVKATFDSVMERNGENLESFVRVVRKILDEEKLMTFDKGAMAEVVEHATRLAGNRAKLTTRFTHVKDILVEADYWARQAKSEVVQRNHVDQANEERIKRLSLPEDKILEYIENGTILIDTEGAVIGQVNGLSVYDLGDYSFGKPSRITATTSIGSEGIVNIEREVELSGSSHDKGVMILAGWLRDKFAQDKPLSVEASLCFEQSYSGVDGDSASSTEIYAILSSLADVPIRQDIAVTGSVNQNGFIQPIGGVNEKIEGFLDVCRVKSLTGKQGVLIPHQNVQDLMLRKDVVDLVREGRFHVYPIRTIDEGIEILTGMPAGQCDEQGNYPEDSIYGKADRKLKKLAEILKSYE